MKYLLIDTNIYLFCSFATRDNYEPELLRRIGSLLDQPDVCLLVPEVVELEYRRNVEHQAKQYESSVDAATDAAVTVLSAQRDKAAITTEFSQIKRTRQDATALARRYFENILANPKVVRVPIEPTDIARALATSIAGHKPSKGKTARERADLNTGEPGYVVEPDCLIVAGIARELAGRQAGEGDLLLICSDNRRDFGAWMGDQSIHALASEIARTIPCPSKYFVGLDELLASEFIGLELTPDEKATYAEAAEEARLTTAPPLRHWVQRCTTCGAERELDSALPPKMCGDCGSQCEAELATSAEPTEQRTTREILCPSCGNQMQVRITSGRDRRVRRYCLQCYSRLQLETATGTVSVLGKADPLAASGAGRSRGLLVLVCPLCDRHQSSFVRTEDGRYFAYCGNSKHGDQLLMYSAETACADQLPLDTDA